MGPVGSRLSDLFDGCVLSSRLQMRSHDSAHCVCYNNIMYLSLFSRYGRAAAVTTRSYGRIINQRLRGNALRTTAYNTRPRGYPGFSVPTMQTKDKKERTGKMRRCRSKGE